MRRADKFRTSKKSWTKFINESNQHLVSEQGINLLDKMLKYDQNDRITPREAMQHEYFTEIRELHGTHHKEV